jgi:Xaa-Pro aminopeptidase
MPANALLVWMLRSMPVLLGLAAIAGPAHAQRGARFVEWTAPVFAAQEYLARRSRVLASLSDNDVLLVPSSEGTSSGETFRQLNDFEYLVGLEIPRSLLLIDRRTQRSVLFVPLTDPRFENPGRPNDFPGRPLVSDPSLRALSGVDSVVADTALPAMFAALAARGATVHINSGRVGALPANAIPGAVASFFGAPSEGITLLTAIQRAHPTVTIRNAYELLAGHRMIKSAAEIAIMRETARITMIGIARGAARIRPGADERSLTGAFTADCLSQGAQRDAFTPIIKSGPNSLWPWRILGAHYDRRNRAMQSGDLVIYDVGCERQHYVSDVGRTFPVSATFSADQRELVDMVRRISDAVIAAARPGVTLSELQRVAVAATPVTARRYMQAPLYFGHHIGLDAGDPSLADARLAPGMIFTIEPWYYNHDTNLAVFLEDEILITATGAENLTAGLPRDADGLERLRAGRTAPARSGPR